ncbi:MAG: hypothetical protein ACR2NK_06545 [Mariniblastus sp.]
MPRSLKYIERCTGASHRGDAWIGFVETPKNGRTFYFNGRAYARAIGGGISGNTSTLRPVKSIGFLESKDADRIGIGPVRAASK